MDTPKVVASAVLCEDLIVVPPLVLVEEVEFVAPKMLVVAELVSLKGVFVDTSAVGRSSGE